MLELSVLARLGGAHVVHDGGVYSNRRRRCTLKLYIEKKWRDLAMGVLKPFLFPAPF
jgi:hypothetical protein